MRTHRTRTLSTLLASNAHHYPDVPAYVCGDRLRTHAALHAVGLKLGSALHRAGLRRQDRVAILAMNCLEYMDVYAAGWICGFITATVNFRLAPAEMAWIIGNVTPKIVFFESRYSAALGEVRGQLAGPEIFVCIGPQEEVPAWAVPYEAFLASGDEAGPPLRALPDDIACIIHTSGTTGRPKGCMLGQHEMSLWGPTMGGEQKSGPGERLLLVMPLFHVGALGVGVAQQYRGGTIHLHRQFDPAALLSTVEREKITTTHLAPTMVQMVLDHPEATTRDLSSLHTIIYAAAPMPGPLLRKGLDRLGNVFMQYYGQTEVIGTTLFKEHHRPNGDERDRERLMSVGIPFAGAEVRIVDHDGLDCPPGTPGELLIRSPTVFRGYWNNTAATLETLRDGWCHTGDVGRLDDQGFLTLVDRKKDVIISGGENIYSREVEEAVVQHPDVAEVAVIGIPDPKWGESVCAVVVRRSGSTVTAESLIAHARTLIAGYKVPKSVRFVDELPKLPSGKIDKKALRKPA